MQDKNLKSKNDKTFLIIIIVFLLMLCALTLSGCAFLAWKLYPIVYLSMNKKNTSQNFNYNEKSNDAKKQENVYVPVEDKIKEETKTTYYDISGFTSEELNKQMQTLGPEWTSTERVYAMANCTPNWSLPLQTDQGCTAVEVELNCGYIMPHWTNYEEASLVLQQNWDNFYALLEKHEHEHGNIAKQETEKYLSEVKNIKEYNSCQEFDDKVYPIHEKYLLEIGQLQDEYDNETNHGVEEGVVLY